MIARPEAQIAQDSKVNQIPPGEPLVGAAIVTALRRPKPLGLSAFGFASEFGFRLSAFFKPSAVAALVVLALSPAALAQQQNTPHIGYAYPAGGRAGTTLQVRVGGQLLEGVTNVYVSGSGVRARVLEMTKPLTAQQANKLRETMRELQEKRQAAFRSSSRPRGVPGARMSSTNVVWTAQDEKSIAEIRRKLATFQRRPPNPAIAETVLVQVTLAPDAEPGERELRIGTPTALSNPLLFCVGQLPEFSKQDAKTAQEARMVAAPLRRNQEPESAVPRSEMNITLPTTVNGQILQGGVDRFRFPAQQGQHLVIIVSARELIPYLADAVPGWFQATLTLYDAKAKELAYDDDFRFHPDPVLHFDVPSNGEYIIEIKDAIYRGREDFVYRLTIGELPFVTGIFPLGGKVGTPTKVALKGWNLPLTELTLDPKPEPGIYPVFVRKGTWVSNHAPFKVDDLPETLEQEPNDTPANAQAVKLPIIVNGRIDKPGDCDVFRFGGSAGEQIVAEVYARRLDSPLDSVLKLSDASGKQLAFNDDHEDKGTGLNTHHADSYLAATLPANGTYYLHLGDAQRHGGPEYAYRLRLSPPHPDFDLRVVPASISLRGGASVPLTVYALRKDGFTNEISIALKEAPLGFKLSGARVPAGQDQVRLTLTAPPRPTEEPLKLTLEGQAIIQGQSVTRPAVPAEDMMQAFAYRHLVPAQELDVAVSARFMSRSEIKIVSSTPVKIPAGGTARVQLATPTSGFAGRFQLELNDAPEGIAIGSVSPSGSGAEIVFKSDAAKVKPGLKGNLVVNIMAGPPPGAAKAKKQTTNRRFAVGTLPAIPFEIVAR